MFDEITALLRNYSFMFQKIPFWDILPFSSRSEILMSWFTSVVCKPKIVQLVEIHCFCQSTSWHLNNYTQIACPIPCILSSADVILNSWSLIVVSKAARSNYYWVINGIFTMFILFTKNYRQYQPQQLSILSHDRQLFPQVFPPELLVQLWSCSHHPLHSPLGLQPWCPDLKCKDNFQTSI